MVNRLFRRFRALQFRRTDLDVDVSGGAPRRARTSTGDVGGVERVVHAPEEFEEAGVSSRLPLNLELGHDDGRPVQVPVPDGSTTTIQHTGPSRSADPLGAAFAVSIPLLQLHSQAGISGGWRSAIRSSQGRLRHGRTPRHHRSARPEQTRALPVHPFGVAAVPGGFRLLTSKQGQPYPLPCSPLVGVAVVADPGVGAAVTGPAFAVGVLDADGRGVVGAGQAGSCLGPPVVLAWP